MPDLIHGSKLQRYAEAWCMDVIPVYHKRPRRLWGARNSTAQYKPSSGIPDVGEPVCSVFGARQISSQYFRSAQLTQASGTAILPTKALRWPY